MSGAGDKGEQFAKHAAAVARDLLGEPNKALSSDQELRFGDRGKVSVDLKTGQFFDHKDKVGGGVLWFIERMTGKPVKGGEAVQWLRDNGYYVDDRDAGHSPTAGNGERKGPRFDRNGNYLPERVPDHGELTKTFDYLDEHGNLAYQVQRFDWSDPAAEKGRDKTFVQRRPDSSKKHGWSYTVKGTKQLPYRLPELIEDIADGAEIFIVEGEKKVDMLRELGVPATCNTGGGGKWPDDLIPYFKGARLVIVPDNDQTGQAHVNIVATKLLDVAERIRVLEIPDLPPHGSVDDWLPAGGSAEQLYELALKARPFEEQPFESKFGAVDWLDIDLPGPKHEWLVKKVLTRNEVSMLAGASQSGKTFLALDLALSVARGIPWFGRRSLQGGVVYCASESALGVRRKRLPAYRKHYQVADEALPFKLLQKPIDLYANDDHAEALIEECRHYMREFERHHGIRLELIVIDTLSAVTPGWDENSSRDVGPVLARCARLREALNCHVMLVHHLNAEGTKARGHTSIFANLENVIVVGKLADSHDADGRAVREAKVTKQKEEEDGETLKFVLPAIEIGRDGDGDKITSCIVAQPSGEAGAAIANPGAIQLGGANAKVLRALYDVLSDPIKRTPAPPELGLRQGTMVADRKDHTARFGEIERPDNFDELPDDDRKKASDAARQALKRARDTLYTKGIIGMEGNWLWLTGKPVQGFGPPPGSRRAREKKAVEERPAPPPFAEDEDFDPRDM